MRTRLRDLDEGAKGDFVKDLEYEICEDIGCEREDFEYEIEIEFCWFECEYEERALGEPVCEGGEFESVEIEFRWFECEYEERAPGEPVCEAGEFEPVEIEFRWYECEVEFESE